MDMIVCLVENNDNKRSALEQRFWFHSCFESNRCEAAILGVIDGQSVTYLDIFKNNLDKLPPKVIIPVRQLNMVLTNCAVTTTWK